MLINLLSLDVDSFELRELFERTKETMIRIPFELSRRARYDVWEPGEYDLNKANSAFERVKGLFSAHSLISKSFPANSGTALLPYLSDS